MVGAHSLIFPCPAKTNIPSDAQRSPIAPGVRPGTRGQAVALAPLFVPGSTAFRKMWHVALNSAIRGSFAMLSVRAR